MCQGCGALPRALLLLSCCEPFTKKLNCAEIVDGAGRLPLNQLIPRNFPIDRLLRKGPLPFFLRKNVTVKTQHFFFPSPIKEGLVVCRGGFGSERVARAAHRAQVWGLVSGDIASVMVWFSLARERFSRMYARRAHMQLLVYAPSTIHALHLMPFRCHAIHLQQIFQQAMQGQGPKKLKQQSIECLYAVRQMYK